MSTANERPDYTDYTTQGNRIVISKDDKRFRIIYLIYINKMGQKILLINSINLNYFK